MKKTTIKAAKTSASAPKVAAKTVKKVAAPSRKKVEAPAVKAAPSKTVATLIGANIDIGFGNILYIRGEGAGLSWDEGVPLECVKDDFWSISLPETSKSIIYKFLINDLTWSAGPDYVAVSGKKTIVSPTF
ncbi:MAG TPA: hypothetical protein VL357_10015 [Rariglobus sp.]|jgi:hypothetical protein|nr:hypothetical protein [Rariglobus sp.]